MWEEYRLDDDAKEFERAMKQEEQERKGKGENQSNNNNKGGPICWRQSLSATR